MKIIIYLGHPAQYHYFKNIVKQLRQRKHEILYLIKTKDILEKLLLNDDQEFINILPKGRRSTREGILIGLLKRDLRLFKIARKEKPDLMIGTDTSLTHVGKILSIPALTVLEDDYYIIKPFAKLTFPFSSKIIAPVSCDCGKWNSKKISYSGYMKLAYLHPNSFQPTQMNSRKYFLIRISGLDAYHDFNVDGFKDEILKRLIKLLSPHGEVKLLSENNLGQEFLKYSFNINPNNIHNYLFNAELLISDSQSMTMEAAMLGIPSIRFSDFVGRIGVLEELEHKYKLTFGVHTSEPEKLFQIIYNLLNISNLKKEFQKRRQNMLLDKIDVTAFMVWFIENYPKSAQIMKNNPDYQYNFK